MKKKQINSQLLNLGIIKSNEGWIPTEILQALQFNTRRTNQTGQILKENLEKGYIQSSESLMASPFFFVKKKDGKQLWPCQDYRYLNEWTWKNAYPLISEIMDKLKDTKYFTKLDIQ